MIGTASLLRMMPKGYEEACYTTKAIVRKRDIKDPNDLMMLVLFHLLTGCTLMEVSEISKLAKLGDISDVAFMKRFKNCNEWFKWIINSTTSEGLISYEMPKSLKQYRILAVDASDVLEKGASGRILRLHFALDIIHMHAALYKISGNDVGEHLRNFEIQEKDLVLADRIYSSVSGIEYCASRKSQYVMRMRINSFKPYDSNGTPIDLLTLMQEHNEGEIHAFAKKERGEDKGKLFPVRICYQRKSPDSIETSRKKLQRKAVKKQQSISEKTYSFNEFIVLITSLPNEIPLSDVLGLYRYRWQVELYFKRLKSILGYGDLPKKTEESIYAWLNGKLMIALLMEKMMGDALFSPLYESFEEYMERDEDFIPISEVQSV